MSDKQTTPYDASQSDDVKSVFASEGFQRTLAAASVRRLRAGEAIIVQGRRGKAAFFVASGEVEVLSESAYGAVRLATLAAPRLVGEVGALAGLPRTASIRALTDVVVYRISRDDLLTLGRAEPDLLLSIVAELGRQLDGFNRTISLYANALDALERSEFDGRLLEDLANPPPQTAMFTQAFRRFADQIVTKRRQQEEMASAAAIQRSLLPNDAVLVGVADLVDLHATIRPAREVGGDFYDYFLLDQERLVVSVGDVCGKGLPASLFAAIVVTVLRTTVREEARLERAIERANAILCRDNAASLFATLFIGVLNVRTGRFDYCNCGHNAPMILSASEIHSLPATGLPLAMLDDRVAKVAHVDVAPGDTVVIYSDGVTEALNDKGEEFGDQRLVDLVRSHGEENATESVMRVVTAVDVFAADMQQADDITFVALKIRRK